MFKKIAVLVAAVAVSAPAFADRGNHYGHYKQGHRFDHRPVHVVHRPVVHRPVVHHYYRPAPRPVVVYHQPRPVYYHSHPSNGAALLAGAILGAAIVHHVVTGY
jgi:hypothetical protein